MWSEAMKREPVCERCDGRMTFECFAGQTDFVGCWQYSGWRCVCCGEVIDSVILVNRVRGGGPKAHRPRLMARRFFLDPTFRGDGFK